MIFITIGSQLPFDRMVRAVDQVVPKLKDVTIVAQAGESNYKPKFLEMFKCIPPETFDNYLREAELVITHAGKKTIHSTLALGKPTIVMPRLKKYGEVTTDYQLAVAERLEGSDGVCVAYGEAALQDKLIEFCRMGQDPINKRNPIQL